MSDMYEVIEKDGVSGLTIGNYSYKAGFKFDRKQWPYSDEALKIAIKEKRCQKVNK
jgi:hypothetical protein